MPEKTIHELLKDSFPSATKESWLKAATLEIDGKDPNEALAWTEDGLTFSGYYDQKDVPADSFQSNFQLSVSPGAFFGPRAWTNMPGIIVTDEKDANKNALAQLASGADGILFDLRDNAHTNVDVLLNQIDWPYCSISFRANNKHFIFSALSKYLQQKKYDPALLTGAIFWDNDFQKNNNEDDLHLFHLEKFQVCGLIINPSTPTKEISDALLKGVYLLDQLTENGIDVSTAVQNITFSLPVSPNFFIEIAKLKALRLLWFQIARAYGQENYQPSSLHLHVRSEVWTNVGFQPNENMIKGTTAAMAAVLGGCNSLTVGAEDNSSMMNRIARNISNVLREESYLDKVADATAGAYAIEKMVVEIAQASWLDFQQQIKKS